MDRELARTRLEYEFIDGIDGNKLPANDSTIASAVWLAKSPAWPGAIGCALSHLKAYEKIVQDNVNVGLVLEDDVKLPSGIHELAESVAAHMTGTDVVLLQYFSYYSAARGEAFKFSKERAVNLPQEHAIAFPVDVADVGGAAAYLITREACEVMAKTVIPVRAPADDWAFYFAERAFRTVRCVVPMPIELERGFRTTIDHHSPRSLQTLIRKAAVRVPGLNQALTWRRQRIIDLQTKVEFADRPADQRAAWTEERRPAVLD
jgi:glycosyl transferase family 25